MKRPSDAFPKERSPHGRICESVIRREPEADGRVLPEQDFLKAANALGFSESAEAHR